VSLEGFIDWGFSEELAVLLVSALPILELRGAIPVAITVFDIPWQSAFVLAFIGNILSVPFILLLLDKMVILLERIGWIKNLMDRFFRQTRKRGSMIEKYKRFGLIAFVAIPLPITGAWTGSIAAVLFGIPFWTAFFSIIIGVFIAGVIVTVLTLLGWIGAFIAGVVLLSLIALWLFRGNNENEVT